MSNEIHRLHVSLEYRVKNIEETFKELKYFLESDEINMNEDAAKLRDSILTALSNNEYRMRHNE